MQLQGKVALITGGAAGIGRAAALLFAAEGAAVAVVDLDGPAAAALAETIRGRGGQAIGLQCDASQAADAGRAVEETLARLGGLDILFNNVGIVWRANVLETSEEQWDQAMAVNVKSIYLFSRLAIPVMARAGGGVIVNTASGWGLVGGRDAISYCASKGAVVNMTRAMALDHGSQHIRVNCICPGDTDTGMLRAEAVQLGKMETEFLAAAADRPLGRVGRPDEIAQAVLYLVSDQSSYVTGTTLVVDGGGLAG